MRKAYVLALVLAGSTLSHAGIARYSYSHIAKPAAKQSARAVKYAGHEAVRGLKFAKKVLY